ncbi:SigE family RNA polymerase sigma factor [Nocardioides sp. URHA0020]|uniref:SigE family RNA polymerase sigma factor n=1 Tax=Nocardioides sp. URHA0020 TaxID=1380392 RepID=UPI00048CC622|nr:SigE family RNA polymerase sigma factor [Nocardioides sp. URHA0020]
MSASYEEFVAARGPALFRTAYLLTGSRADAEDLVQVSLVKLFVSWSRAARAKSVEGYARRVLVNAYISGRRPARHTREHLVSSPPDVAMRDPEVDTALTLWPHVRALPPRQRAVIVLRYANDLSEADIAHALGCAPGTVKSTAAAALATLRQRMADQEGRGND